MSRRLLFLQGNNNNFFDTFLLTSKDSYSIHQVVFSIEQIRMIKQSYSDSMMEGRGIVMDAEVLLPPPLQVDVDTSLLEMMEYEGARSARSARGAISSNIINNSINNTNGLLLHQRRDSGVSSMHSSTKSNTTNQFWMNCLDSDTNSLPTPLDSKNSSSVVMAERRYSFNSVRLGPEEQQQQDECKENKRGNLPTGKPSLSQPETSTLQVLLVQGKAEENSSTNEVMVQEIETKPSYDNSTLVGTELLESHEEEEESSSPKSSISFAASTTTDNDPYRWAYDVWKKHGLMHYSKGNSRRPVATKIADLQDQIWNEKLTGPKKTEKPTGQQQHLKPKAASRKSFSIQQTSYVNRGSFDDYDGDSHEQRKVSSGRLSLPASVHASASSSKMGGKKNFANVLQKWREQSDNKPNSHFLSPEQLRYPSYVAKRNMGIGEPEGREQQQEEDARESIPESESLAKVQDPPCKTPAVSSMPETILVNNEVTTEMRKQEEVLDANKERSTTSTRRTNMLLQKKRMAALEEELKEPKPTSPKSQASRIKARYMETRHPSQSRSRSRGPRSRTVPKDPSPTNQQRPASRSPTRKSRGDFKTAVQDVLRRVDVISDIVEPRPVSAPRSGRKEAHHPNVSPTLRTKSAPRSGREPIRSKIASKSLKSNDEVDEKPKETPFEPRPVSPKPEEKERSSLPVRVSQIQQEKERSTNPPSEQMSIHRVLSRDSLNVKTNTIDPPGTMKKVKYRVQKQAPRPESAPLLTRQKSFDESSSLRASYTPGKSKFELELRRAVSAPRPRQSDDGDDKPKPENKGRLAQLRARRIARQAKMNQRPKSAPRPERSPTMSSSKHTASRSNYAYGGSAHIEPDKLSPTHKSPVRVKDLLKLNTGSSYRHRGQSSASVASIPSHVEVKRGMSDDDEADEGASLADSKLTDARTDSESSVGVPVKGDSPWTAQMLSKLEKYQGDGGVTPRSEINTDRPWRRDRLKKRMKAMSDKPTMALGEGADDSCCCSKTVFSDRDELIEFFLPLLGTGCTCGKRPHGLVNPDEPTAIENILRPWQVEFLAAFGIYRGDQMVKAHHRSAGALATALRQYRKRKKMTSFRTKSCVMALEIWSKTCRAFVRSIRKQLETGTSELKLPNTLYILSSFLEKLPSDDALADHAPSVVTSSTVKRPRAHTPTSGSIRERAQQLRETRRNERSESPRLASRTF